MPVRQAVCACAVGKLLGCKLAKPRALPKRSTLLQVLQAAVCPERRYGVDDELSAIATVTEVELSKDLAVAKIYIQIYSDPTGQDQAWDGLQRLQGCGASTSTAFLHAQQVC